MRSTEPLSCSRSAIGVFYAGLGGMGNGANPVGARQVREAVAICHHQVKHLPRPVGWGGMWVKGEALSGMDDGH